MEFSYSYAYISLLLVNINAVLDPVPPPPPNSATHLPQSQIEDGLRGMGMINFFLQN
jgi:hypothetical protein